MNRRLKPSVLARCPTVDRLGVEFPNERELVSYFMEQREYCVEIPEKQRATFKQYLESFDDKFQQAILTTLSGGKIYATAHIFYEDLATLLQSRSLKIEVPGEIE